MNQTDALAYVRAAAVVMALPLDDDRALRVAAHLVVSGGLARVVQEHPLASHDEPAEIYRPAPFPDAGTGA